MSDQPKAKVPKRTYKGLFVYLGTTIVEFCVDATEEDLKSTMTWDSRIAPTQSLKEAESSAYETIQKDLKNLRKHCGLETNGGDFHQIQCSPEYLYVYMHKKHLAYSNLTLTMLSKFCDVAECKCYVASCDNHACHEVYFPYFYGNNQLKHTLEKLQDDNEELFQKISTDKLFCNTARFPCNYTEDEWTERLNTSLQLNNIDSELTAYLRGPNVKKSWENKLPVEIDARCLVFQGAPDIIIHKKKDERKEGVVVTNFENEKEAEEVGSSPDSQGREEEASSLSDSQGGSSSDSQSSGRMQMAHQMTKLHAYKAGSFLFEKVAELVGALHTSLACRALQRYKKNKRCDSLTAHGLHIHRAVGIIHIEVVLSKGTMVINATHLFDGVSSPEYFCAIMKYYMDKLKKYKL